MDNNTSYVFKCNCTGLAIISSIILGIIAAVLTFTAVVAVTPAFLWVVFGIAVVYLAVLLLTSAFSCIGVRRCIAAALPALLTGIFGSILTAIVLLAITFAATSVIGAILVGLLIFFLSLIVTVTGCIIKCITGCAASC